MQDSHASFSSSAAVSGIIHPRKDAASSTAEGRQQQQPVAIRHRLGLRDRGPGTDHDGPVHGLPQPHQHIARRRPSGDLDVAVLPPPGTERGVHLHETGK
jgi:hypothetical protein